MLPPLRQRVLLLVAIVAGAFVLLLTLPVLRPADGSSGLAVMSAGGGGAAAVGVLLAAFVPVIVLAVLAGTMGNMLAGLFVPATALTVLAWRGGPIDGWMHRHAHPASFAGLAAEAFGWLVLFAGIAAILGVTRPRLRSRLGGAGFDPLGLHRPEFAMPTGSSLWAGLAAALIGGALALFLMRSTDVGQITFSLILCFTIAGLSAQFIFPETNPVAIALSPLLVAIVASLYVRFSYNGHAQVIDGWYRAIGAAGPSTPIAPGVAGRPLPGLVLALPIHYASAGIVGATLGIGWAQTMMLGHRGVETPDGEPDGDSAAPRNAKAPA